MRYVQGLFHLAAHALLAILAIALLTPSASFAQVVTATLTGTVTDSSGAVVPNAAVTATEVNTGVSRATHTSAEGVYSLPFLNPGTYKVDVEKEGFKKFTEGNVPLNVSSVGRVDAVLTLGNQAESVQVTAESPLMQVESADVSKDIDLATETELPLPNRSAQDSAGLVAGVTIPALYSSGSGILENGAMTYMFDANGQVLGANNTMVDGIDNMDMALGLTLYQPATEDVSEVKVVTNSYSAEFGKVGGAVVNIVTRSGTNTFHGTAFEFNKTAALGARNVFNQAPQPKAGLTNNDYGGTVGGPIKKNKIFFFASYEGRKNYSRSQTTTTTAQTAWLTGNFSAVPGLQLYDPNSGASNGSGRSLFPNNVVPQSEFSPISQKLLQYIPAPNLIVAGAPPFTLNYIYSAPTDYTSNSVDGRVDYNFNEKSKLAVKFDTLPYHVYEGAEYSGEGVGNDLQSHSYSVTGAIDYTYMFSPTLVMEARANFNRWVANISCTNTVTNQSLGIFDPNPDNISTQSMALITGIGIGAFGQSYECPTVDHDTVFPFSDTWTKSMGKHSIKWGGDFVRYRNDRFQTQGSSAFGGRGYFAFSPSITENYLGSAGGSPLGTYGTVVNPFAAFLLGDPAEDGRAQTLLAPTMRQSHADGFIQDSYKVTPKFTLDIGLRYDFYEAVKVRYAGGASNFDPANNSLLIAGYGNIGLSDGVNSKPGYWGPRLGLAYSLNNTTVIRAGYGISYWEQRFGYTGGTLNQQYPVIYNVQLGATTNYTPQAFSIAPITYVSAPSNGILSPAPNQAYYTMPTHYDLPEVYTWNLTVQHQITPTLVVDAGWVANMGRELPYAININQGAPGAGPTAEILNVAYGRTASTTLRAYGVNSDYNSLQVNITKKLTKGMHVSLAYTFSKSLDETAEDGSFLNPNNYKLSWGPSSFDQTNLITINHVYELPFGKGEHFLNHGGVAAAILGNWQLSGIFRYASGTPFTPSAATTNADCASCSAVAQIVGTPQYPGLYGPGQQYLSTSAFALPPADTYGDSGRDNLRAPGVTVYDGNIVRKFNITERGVLELRFEATNVTNHPEWGAPGATFGTATFGQVTTANNPRQAQVAARLSF